MRSKSVYYSSSTEVYQKARAEIRRNKTEWENAVEVLNKTLENASGMYATSVAQSDGSVITYIHDKRTIAESKNVIKITSEAIGISNDGGKTYPYGLTLTGELIAKILYTVGINADYINSGSIMVKDKDGDITFFADTETGKVIIKADSLSITGKTVEEIIGKQLNNFVDGVYKIDLSDINEKIDEKNANYYQDTDPALSWTGITKEPWLDANGKPILDISGKKILIYCESEKMQHEGDRWKNTANNEEYIYKKGHWVKICMPDSIMQQIDGKIDTYYYDYIPTLTNYPASEWTTDDEKVSHNGDLFFHKTYGYTYRFLQENGEWRWKLIQDSDIEDAMLMASDAQDTADGKRRVFVSTPEPPYDVGDLWTNTKDLYRCKTARTSKENYNSSDWILATEYTDDSAVKKLDEDLDVDGVLNRLTNNGEIKGIYKENGELYINATYIKSGSLTLGGAGNSYGILQIYNENDEKIGEWDSIGLWSKGSIISAGDQMWMELNDGVLSAGHYEETGATEDAPEAYVSANTYYKETGISGLRLGGKGCVAIHTPVLGVGDYVEALADGTIDIGQSGSLKVVTNFTSEFVDVNNVHIYQEKKTITFKQGLMVTQL